MSQNDCRFALFFLLYLVFILLPSKVNSQSASTIGNSKDFVARAQYKIEDIEIRGDTLSIVSSDDFVEFPFGLFRGIEEFAGRNRSLTIDKRAFFYPPDSTKTIDSLFVASSDKSHIVLISDTTNYRGLEILSGHVADNKLLFREGIRIGMSKRRFVNTFFAAIDKRLVDRTKVVEIWYVVGYFRHRYIFEHERLLFVDFLDYSSITLK